jgi:hypothetical protein
MDVAGIIYSKRTPLLFIHQSTFLTLMTALPSLRCVRHAGPATCTTVDHAARMVSHSLRQTMTCTTVAHAVLKLLVKAVRSDGEIWIFPDGTNQRRMTSSGTLRRVALVRTDVSEKLSASIIRVTRVGELGTLAVTSNRRTLRRNTIATRRNIPEDAILHSHRRENLKSYTVQVKVRLLFN